MSSRSGFVADFTPVIVDQTLQPRTRTWAWERFQAGFSLQFDDTVWAPQRTWEAEGAMSCGIRFLDAEGRGIDGLAVHVGWPGVSVGATTHDGGWVDVPTAGGNYAGGQAGPMWIRLDDGTLRYDGIGWRDATNHAHLNLDVRRGAAPTPPPDGGGAVNRQFIHQRALDAKAALDEVRVALDDILRASE